MARFTKLALVVVAHGDDETNGMGGTLHRLKEGGWKIHIVYATLPAENDPRRSECAAAADYLGATHEVWGLTDGKLEDNAKTRAMAVKVYGEHQPSLVIGLHGLDVHPDHRAISALALGPAMQRGVNIEYFTCELCASGRHTDADRPQSLGFMPTHYVDTSLLSEKVAGMTRCHESQDPEAMIEGMARMHAIRAEESGIEGCTQAEPFIRLTRVGELHPEIAKIFKPSPFALPRSIGCDFDPKNIGIEV